MTGYLDNPAFTVLLSFGFFMLLSIAVILALWVALPFSVFGIKGLMKRSIEEQERTNRLLAELLEAMKSAKTGVDTAAPLEDNSVDARQEESGEDSGRL